MAVAVVERCFARREESVVEVAVSGGSTVHHMTFSDLISRFKR